MLHWLIIGAVLFVFLHKALEGIVAGEGNPRRKFLWNMGTAGFFAIALAAAWVGVLGIPEWRNSYLTVLFFATPVAVIMIAVFAYANYLVYTEDVDNGKRFDDSVSAAKGE